MLVLFAVSIIGSSSWVIVQRSQKVIGDATSDDINPCFTSEVVYNGNAQKPTLNDMGKEVYGFTSDSEYTIKCLSGPDETYFTATGVYIYEIIDNRTGQIISEKHSFTIKPDILSVGTSSITSVSPPTDIGGTTPSVPKNQELFVGDTVTLTLSLKGQNTGNTVVSNVQVDYKIKSEDYKPSTTVGCVAPTVYVDISSINLSAYQNSIYDKSEPAECVLTDVTILPKCYTTTAANTTPMYYGDLEQALAATAIENAPGTKLVAMQSFTYNSTTYSASTLATTNRYTHEITKSVTIASNVNLNIPYNSSGSVYELNPATTNATIYVPTCKNVISVGTYNDSGKLVGDGIVITNNGGISVGGVLGAATQSSSSGAGYPPAGVTSGSFSILAMGANATMNCGSSSSLDVRGYITAPASVASSATEEERENADNGAKINVASGGLVTMPFLVYDFHGGSHVSTTYTRGDIAPFSVYDMPNLHARITYKAGAKIVGLANMYANSEYNVSNCVILSKSGALLNLTSGEATFKYTPTQLDSFGTDTANSKPHMDARTKIEFKGNMTTGALSLKVKIQYLGEYNADMSTVTCPICHKFDLTFSGGADYSIISSYKIMPGAGITIDKGATVSLTNSSSVIFYSDDIYDSMDTIAASHVPWSLNKTARPGAKFVLNGTLNVPSGSSFAADITSTELGAKLNLSSAGLSVSSVEGYGTGNPLTGSFTTSYTETGNARGIILSKSGSGFSNTSGNLSNLVYVSAEYSSGSFGWLDASVSFNLNYVHVGADGQTVNNSNPTTYTPVTSEIALQIPTATGGLSFAGWFTDSECSPENQVTVTDGITLFAQSGGDATLYAKWVTTSYSVSFDTSIDAGNVSVSIADMHVASGELFNPYENLQIKELVEKYRYNYSYSRYFDGWYTSSSFADGTRVDEESGIVITAKTTLYAKWGVKYKISFSIPTDKGINYTIADVWLAPGDSFDPYSHNTEHTDYNNNVAFQYYFDAWYSDSTYSNKVSNEFVMSSSNVTFYANWLSKLKISMTCDTYKYALFFTRNVVDKFVVNGATTVSVGGSFYLLPEQSCVITITGNGANITGVSAGAGSFVGDITAGTEVTVTYVAPSSGSTTIHVSGTKT